MYVLLVIGSENIGTICLSAIVLNPIASYTQAPLLSLINLFSRTPPKISCDMMFAVKTALCSNHPKLMAIIMVPVAAMYSYYCAICLCSVEMCKSFYLPMLCQ